MEGMKSSYFKHLIESSLQMHKNQTNKPSKNQISQKNTNHCLETGKRKLLNYYVSISLYTYMHIPILQISIINYMQLIYLKPLVLHQLWEWIYKGVYAINVIFLFLPLYQLSSYLVCLKYIFCFCHIFIKPTHISIITRKY